MNKTSEGISVLTEIVSKVRNEILSQRKKIPNKIFVRNLKCKIRILKSLGLFQNVMCIYLLPKTFHL